MKLTCFHLDGAPRSPSLYSFARVLGAGPESDRYQRHLAGGLSAMSGQPEEAERLLRAIERVERGEASTEICELDDETEAVVRSDGVQIGHLIADDWTEDEEGRFRLATFKAAVQGWVAFLRMPDPASALEVELPEEDR
ncbi:MAG: hypothetical protein QM767_08480 [Anaeromyxobacter sp.]